MRALHVGDSKALEDAEKHLMVLNIRAFNRRGKLQAPIEDEALRPDSVFKMEMKVDTALYSGWAKKRKLHLKGKNWLENLPQIVHAHNREMIESELARYQKNENAARLAAFYKQLEKVTEAPSSTQFLLQLGAGTGWQDKTFGSRLKVSDPFMHTILRPRYERGYGVARKKPPRTLSDFPLSRRVAVAFRKNDRGGISETPAYPLGWVLVEMQEKKQN